MEIREARRDGPRVVLGLVLLALGVLFTLDKLGYVDAGRYWEYWPLFLVAVGVGRLIEPRRHHGRGFGVFLIVLGIWLLLSNLDLIQYQVWEFWPVLLVLFGLSIVWRALRGGRREPAAWGAPGDAGGGPGASPGGGGAPTAMGLAGEPAPAAGAPASAAGDAASTVNAFALLGGVRRRSVSRSFRGGDLTAIMGGCELDLRQAAIAGGEAVLDTFAFWGGIEIKVPETWTVVVHGTPLLGSFDDKTVRAGGDGSQVLVIHGTAIMGGVEVKN